MLFLFLAITEIALCSITKISFVKFLCQSPTCIQDPSITVCLSCLCLINIYSGDRILLIIDKTSVNLRCQTYVMAT